MGAKGMLVPLLICGLLLSCIQAQTWSLTSIPTTDLDVWSDYVFITASQEPTSTLTITLSESSGTIQFSETTLQYSPTVLSNSFRIKGNKAGGYVVDFAVSGSEFSGIASRVYSINLRTVEVLDFPSNIYIGHPSPPAVISIDVPSTSTLTFTPSSEDNAITFSPSSITLNAGSLSAPFTYIANDVTATSVYVTWSVSGAEADRYYTDGLSSYYTFGIRTRPFTKPNFSGKVLLSAASATQYMYVRDITNATVTITPQAADTTFNPATFTFTPGTQVVPFTYTTTSPTAYSGNKPVSFVMSGEGKDFYTTIASSYISIPKRTINVLIPYSLVLTNESLLSIQLWAPTPNDVTVSFFASRLTFNVSSVTFSGNKTSDAVKITPIGQGTSSISFLITGADADLYETIDDQEVNVGRGSFFGPWYIPTLWVGVESDKIPIRASFSPKTDVTLFFSAPDLKFSPTNVTFRPGQEQQFFTITPLYTSSDADYSSTTISFLVTGTDATYFNAPSSISVTIARRTIQTRWSAHLEFDSTRHLQKEYKVWASANYVGEKDKVSVTPVSPYFSFKPSTLYFTSETTRIEFIAKVTGVVGTTSITYIIGGEDGGWYSPMTELTAFTAIRPLGLARAVLAPDDRVDGVSLDYPSAAELNSYHVYSFTLNSTVLPDSWITITPKSAHVEFSPSSITLHPGDAHTYISRETYIRDYNDYYFWLPGKGVEANFTAHPKAAGVHDVWFELTGDDASYYDVPNHVLMSFWLERRADSEPSAASMVVPALFAVILLIAAIL